MFLTGRIALTFLWRKIAGQIFPTLNARDVLNGKNIEEKLFDHPRVSLRRNSGWNDPFAARAFDGFIKIYRQPTHLMPDVHDA